MIKLFGVEIQNIKKDEFYRQIDNKLEIGDGEALFIVTMNPEIALYSKGDEEYARILKKAFVVVDGFGIKLVKMIQERIILERIVGVEICEYVIKIASAENKSLLVVMRDDGFSSMDEVRLFLKKRYEIKDLKIVSKEDFMINPEKYKNSEVLIVSLGAPDQEMFIEKYIKYLPRTRVAIGVGGTFDYWTGKKKRASKILQKIGLEWLWRFAIQPNRAKRIFNAIILFPYYALTEKYEK